MTNILHLIDTYRVGGPGKTVLNCARFIDRSRYLVHAGAFTHLDPDRNEFARSARQAGVPLLELPERRRIEPNHVRRIRDYVREHDIGILHAHGHRADFFGYLATRGLRIAIVTTHHGWIRNSRKQHLVARFALLLASRFHGIQVVSEQLLSELPRPLRRSGRVAIVRNAIVLEDYSADGHRDGVRASLGVAPCDRLLTVIGRLSPEKGCLEMLEAFRGLAGRAPNVSLAFVGEGPLEPELRRRLADYGLDKRVMILGHQSPIQPFYEAADVIVSPSRTEGLSNVLLEALAFGRPVVATRVGGNAEIIEDGVSGTLVEPNRPAALADAICSLLQDDELRYRYQRNGARRVKARFGFDARMRTEERFYEAVLQRL
jgi:glycosyltransferase involved in cell wall biosynthesis